MKTNQITLTDVHAKICAQTSPKPQTEVQLLDQTLFKMREAKMGYAYYSRRASIFGSGKMKYWKRKSLYYADLFTVLSQSRRIEKYPKLQEGVQMAFAIYQQHVKQ